ncbi:glutamate 5-kinase [Spirochaetota bacterium]
MNNARARLGNVKRLVVKVGTSTLTYESGMINLGRIEKLARVLSDLANSGIEIVLVSSGAIGLGTAKLKLKARPKTVPEKQAAAAVGQGELMALYGKFFSEYSHIVGQILLTRDIVENLKGRQNAINTFESLIKSGVIPIVNENDSVSIEEIATDKNRVFGDNDTLSAIVSGLVDADLLIILSDIDGFYSEDPKRNPDSKLISVVETIDEQLEKCAGGEGSSRGTGGMITKLNAAKVALASGIDVVIANGSSPEIVVDIIGGQDKGTLFVAKRVE